MKFFHREKSYPNWYEDWEQYGPLNKLERMLKKVEQEKWQAYDIYPGGSQIMVAIVAPGHYDQFQEWIKEDHHSPDIAVPIPANIFSELVEFVDGRILYSSISCVIKI